MAVERKRTGLVDGNDKRRKVARVQEEECGETRGRWRGGRARIRRAAYTRILFQYFKRTPGYHAYPRVDGQYLKRTTNVAWLTPPLPLREKGKRIVRRRAKNCRLKLLISFIRSSVFHHLLGWKCM